MHINKTCSLAFYYLYNIRKIRKYLSKETNKKLIHAFVNSRIDYCNSFLFGLPAYQIHKIQRVQNAAARLIYNESKYCRITPLLYNLHCLPVTCRIEFKFLLLIFKAIKGFAPGYITELINVKNEGRYRLRSNSNGILVKYVNFKTYKTLGDRSFMVAAPNLWNNLPLEIKEAPNIHNFKKLGKTFVFKKAFSIYS